MGLRRVGLGFVLGVAGMLAAVPARGAGGSVFGAKDPVPDWVRDAAKQTLPAFAPDTNAVVLLESTTYTVGANGQAVEHFRRVVKILRPQGRDDGYVGVPFDKDSKITSMKVWSIAPDGHEYSMKDQEIEEVGIPGEGNLYDDHKVKVARPAGRDPGGVIAYEYEQKMRPYVTETTWFVQESLPKLNQTFTLELPAGYTYGTVWANGRGLTGDERKGADLEHQKYRWEVKSAPGIDLYHVPMHPAELALAARMTVHYGGPGIPLSTEGTWKSIGEWYDTLSRDRLVATPEIAVKAGELAAGKTDFYDKTEAIAEFVQKQIRYFVIEMGVGGYQPHPAGDIFRNRYGDCKDKATLLSAMLSTVGVHSALMMVDHRRGVIDPAAPSTVGDHMIAAIEVPKGYESAKLRSVVTAKNGRRYLIFDPTWEKTPFGQLEHELQGGYGVLMEGAESQVIELPLMKPELNTISRKASFTMGEDGSLKGTVVEKRFGDVSDYSRYLYTHEDAKAQRESMDHALAEDFAAYAVSDVKIENAEALNKDLTTTFGLSAERFGKATGSLLMLRPRVLGTEGPYPDRKARVVPIDLRETLLAKDEFDIELPAGYAMDEMPDAVKYDAGFASYESLSEMKGNTLHYTRTYTVREVSVPAEKYGDVQKLAGVIAADEQSRAVLKRK